MEPLTGDQKRAIFLNSIQKTYGVGCSPAKTFTMQRPFVDSWNIFGKGRDVLFRDADISIVWNALNKGEWDFDYTNPYVQMWAGQPLM